MHPWRLSQEFSVRFYRLMTSAGLTLLELAAEGCGAPSHTLVNLFRPDPVSTLRYLHYPPRQGQHPQQAYDPTDSEWQLNSVRMIIAAFAYLCMPL